MLGFMRGIIAPMVLELIKPPLGGFISDLYKHPPLGGCVRTVVQHVRTCFVYAHSTPYGHEKIPPTGYFHVPPTRKITPYGVISHEKNTPYGGLFSRTRHFFFEKNTPYAAFFGEKIPPIGGGFSGFRAQKSEIFSLKIKS